MKIGVFTVLFKQRPFEEALDYVKAAGCEAVEIGVGGFPGPEHANSTVLLDDEAARKRFQDAVTSRGLEISALSCHGNPLHPRREIAEADDRAYRNAVQLAQKLEVPTVITFSGCPGGGPEAMEPNWVTCPWPPNFTESLEWQWNERVRPYWSEAATYAKDRGVRVAIELHPGFIAKDTWLDQPNIAINGVLDTKPYTDEIHRSWYFRTVGFGHGQQFWRSLISELRLAGYDGAISIEHEDSLMSVNEGFTSAVEFLKDVIIREPAAQAWWT